jgi:hypothetical protein
MNDLKMRPRGSRAILGRLAMALVLSGMLGGIAAVPARADDRDRGHDEGRDRGHDEGRGRDRDHPRMVRRDHDRRARHVYVAPRPDYVYAPPPVVYAPPPRAGISLFFPIEIR